MTEGGKQRFGCPAGFDVSVWALLDDGQKSFWVMLCISWTPRVPSLEECLLSSCLFLSLLISLVSFTT